jgi:alpha-L-rhamnosidase
MENIFENSRKWFLLVIAITISIVLLQCASRTNLEVVEIKTEYSSNPIGIHSERPRFSWILASDLRGQYQTAYQILVASTRENLNEDTGDLWDSGKIITDRSIHIPYQGKPLASNRCYYLKVRVWGKDQKPGPFSQVASFTTALLKEEDWTAEWIGRGGIQDPAKDPGFYYQQPVSDEAGDKLLYNPRSVLLRKTINVGKKIKQALLHVSGLGYYELSLNDTRIGDNLLSPAKTFYKKIVLYDSYEVTASLQKGENVIGLMLGNGWFNPLLKWWSWRMQWYGPKRAILQLHLTYTDDSEEVVLTDDSWKINDGPVLSSCIYDGEIYDANQEIPGWNLAGFDDSNWKNATVLASPGGRMIPQLMPKIKATETIHPVNLSNPQEGVYIVDLGQNISGWLRIRIQGQKGDTLTLRYAENIDSQGRIDTKSNNLALATDKYILSGKTQETYEPHFTYHGFRYVELRGTGNPVKSDDIEGIVVHSAVQPAGHFSCSDENLNRIHRTTIWSQRANLMGIPTDCPQRDERLGWMGDAHITAEEAIYNFDMALFYKKWLEDIQSNRNTENGDIPYISPRPFINEKGTPAWSSGYHLVVWYLYKYYGDESILAAHFEAMCHYVDHLSSVAQDYILPSDDYGDWLSPDIAWRRGGPLSVSTGYFYYTSRIAAEAARVLHKKAEQQKYESLAEKIKAAYNKKFFDHESQSYEENSQLSNSFPLFLGIADDLYKKAALGGLVADIFSRKGHLSTGILGTKYMMEALSREDHSTIAYLVLTRPDYPGWTDLIRGRTTLSEHWNQGGSNNHVMFGSVDSWFYKVLGGINIDESKPAFKNIIFKPYIAPELTWVKASTKTLYGLVACQWKREGDDLQLGIQIPANTTAAVYILAGKPESVKEGRNPASEVEGVSFVKMEGNYAVYKVESGRYQFKSAQISALLDTPFASGPVISPQDTSVFIPDSVLVHMKTETAGSEIRYTLDNNNPSEQSLLYKGPFALRRKAIIKAGTFKDGYHPSFISTSEISFVEPKVNGLRYNFYEGIWTKLPDFSKLTPRRQGLVYSLGLGGLDVPKYEFALQFMGFLLIQTEGNYRFFVMSNDGSQLYIDGRLVVDNDEEHLMEEKSGSIFLSAGRHPIELTYFQSGGGLGVTVLYEGPGIARQPIPPMLLFQNK